MAVLRVAQSLWRSVAWRRRGIALRLLASVLLFSSVITLVLTLLQLYLDYRRDVGLIQTRLDEIGRSYLGSLADSLWHLDEKQLALQLQGLMRLPDIRAAEVRETAADISPLVLRMGARDGGPVLVREYPLVYSFQGADKPIGRLRVEATLAGVYRELLNRAAVILVSQGAKTFLVSLFIIFIFHRLVTRHLATIADFLSRYDLRRPVPPLVLARRPQADPDELDQTVAAFNTMRESLERAYDELAGANAELERDIAERRHVEEALRDSEELKRRIIESSSDCIKVLDLDGNLLFMSSGGQQLLEIDDIQSYLNTCWIDFWQPEDRAKISDAIATARAGGLGKFQAFCPSAKGAPRWWDVVITPICNADGQPEQLLSVSRDITERKQTEEKQRYHMQLLRTVTDNASSALYILDAAGLGTFVNPSLERMTGYRAEELIGQVVHDKVHHTKPDGTPYPVEECPLTGAIRTRKTVRGEDLFVHKDGTFFPVRYTASPVLRDGVAVATVIEVQDLTERKQAEQALHQAQAELAHVTRVMAMGQLTASIAHEVNQPLAALAANANACLRWLARQPPDLDEAREALHRMVRDCSRAGEVITRIRSLVRKSSPVKARLDLNDAIEEVLAIVEPEARRHAVAVRTDLAASLAPVRGDRVQLQQVILNLVMNGIEATMEVVDGPRELRISSHPHEAGTVLVTVEDNGIGLKPESLERLFEAFYTTKAEGMGIGLSISRSIIEAHGGRLWPSANNERGATFQLTLPADDGSRQL